MIHNEILEALIMPTGGSDVAGGGECDEGLGSEAGNPLVDGCESRVRSRNSPQAIVSWARSYREPAYSVREPGLNPRLAAIRRRHGSWGQCVNLILSSGVAYSEIGSAADAGAAFG